MKLVSSLRFTVTASLALALHVTPVRSFEECTYGLLYVSESGNATEAKIHELSLDPSDNFYLKESMLISKLIGKPNQALESTSNGRFLMSLDWGSEEMGNTDGAVNFIDTGASAEPHGEHLHIILENVKVLSNIGLACGPIWHPKENSGLITLFCDGNRDLNVTSKFYVMDESMLGSSKNPYVFNKTLKGAHHGMAVPIDESHILHTLYEKNHSWGSDILQVVNLKGDVVYSLTDKSNPDSYCKDYHGSTIVNQTVFLCCADHILSVKHDNDLTEWSSQALTFPNTLGSRHRCGDLKGSNEFGYLITDYADWDADPSVPHLAAFPVGADELLDSDVLTLEGGQCYFELEKSREKHLIVMVPNGTVYVYTFGRPDGWKVQASIEPKDIGNLNHCDNATLSSGYAHFYVNVPSTRMLYAIDMTHVDHGELIVTSTELDFTPGYMTVSAVPKGTGCSLDFHDSAHDEDVHDEDEHDHDHEEDKELSEKESSSATGIIHVNYLLLITGTVAFVTMVV